MDCFIDLFNNLKTPCSWDCCKDFNTHQINSNIFWEKIARDDPTHHSKSFFNEKKFHLSDDVALVIGLSPTNQFRIIARLEVSSSQPIFLHSEDIFKFINYVDEKFQSNERYPSMIQMNDRRTEHLRITAAQHNIFKIEIGGNQVTLCEDVLYKLFIQIPMVRSFIKLLESDCENHKTCLMELLHHFCYNKNADEAISLSKSVYVRHFFEECVYFRCNCIDTTLIIAMAVDYTDWFIHCIPIYIKTIMTHERVRMNSFLHGWPHDKRIIDTNIMAISGLYFIGLQDCVECAFCNVRIHTWEIGDNPIKDHYKYSPNCPLLLNPGNTANVSVGNEVKLSQLRSILIDKPFDEAD